ncbi:MAG: 3-hydroxyacyl-CoA dehydrogenase, partial [Piptocephalis tieghemiana]
VGVLGAGQMGVGIALVAARYAKLPVTLVDISEKQLEKGMNFMDRLLAKDVSKEKLTEAEASSIRERIQVGSGGMSDFKESDIVIEAISEDLELKLRVFRDLANATPSHTILASNTSSISISRIAGATPRPESVIGMHFMNPVPVMKLVEVIPGIGTSPETLQTTLDLAVSMGKITTESKDTPGFIANRLLMPYINEAIIALDEGVGTREDIDATMRLGTAVPMGPLTLADFIGLDTCLAIMRVLHNEFGDSKYRPSILLKRYVDAGWLGKKSGRGFYSY